MSLGRRVSLNSANRVFSKKLFLIILSNEETIFSNCPIFAKDGIVIGKLFRESLLIAPKTVPSPLKISNC